MNQILYRLKKYSIPIILIALIIIGIFLRLKLLKSDIWYDESFTILTINKSWQDMFTVIREDLVHPPLYYILTKIWGIVAGYTPSSIRSFSIVFGVLTIPLSYFTAKSINNKNSGIIAALLFTFSPFFITYSVEARAYSLLAFLAILTLYAYHKGSKLFYLLLLSLVFIHYFSILIIISFVLIKLIKYFDVSIKKLLALILTGFCIIFLSSIIISYTDIALFISNLTKDAWINPSDYSDIIKSIAAFLFGVDRQAQGNPPLLLFKSVFSPINLAFLVFCFILIGLVKVQKNQKLLDLYILTFLPILILFTPSLFGINVYVDRYVIASGSFFLLLLSFLLADFKYYWIAITAYVCTTFLIIWPAPISKYSTLATELVDQDIAIVYEDPQDYTVMQFYLPEKKEQFVLLENDDVLNKNALVPDSAGIYYEDMVSMPGYRFIRSGIK